MSLFRPFRLSPLLPLVLFIGGMGYAAPPENSPVLWQSGWTVRDMAVLNGNRLLVATHEKLMVVDETYQEKEVAFPRLDRIFVNQDGATLAAGIAWEDKKAARLYTGELEKPDDSVIFPMDPKGDVFRAGDGALWLVNPKGRIFRHFQGKTEQWEAGRFTDDGRVSGNNAFRFEFAESPEGQVVLYQQGGQQVFGADLNGFLIWDREELRHVRVEGKYVVTPGCAEFLSEHTLLLGSNMGLRVYDTRTGEMLEKWMPPENFFAESVRPFFTHPLSDGTRLVFYCRADGGGLRSGPFEHGGYTQIVEINDGEWKKIPLKVDFTLWDFLLNPRPVLVEKDGAVWTPNRGVGLAHRSPDGTWRSYDVMSGVPFEEITGLVLDGSRLWCAEAKRGLAALDTRQLEAGRPDESPWIKKRLAAEPVWDREGRAFLLSSENGGQIVILSQTGERDVLSLSETGFDSSHTRYMAVDTDGDPWLFGSTQQRYAIAFHKGGVWRTFPRDIKRENQYPPNCEHAFQSMLGKDPAFRVGQPDDPHYPVFSEDGRIVFMNRRRKIRYFDGLTWLTPAWEEESSPKKVAGPLFFHQGNLIAVRDGVPYQLDGETWTNREDTTQPAPWIKLGDDLLPPQSAAHSQSGNVIRNQLATPPPDSPVEVSDITWTHRDGEWVWVGNSRMIAGSPGGDWLRLDIPGTPLSMTQGIEDVIHTPDHRIFFKHRECGHVYSIYTPPTPLEATLGKSESVTIHRRNETLDVNPKLNRDRAGVLQQFRIDQGPWSALIPVGPIQPGSLAAKGEHTLTVVYYGKDDLARSRSYQVPFISTYDLQQEIQTSLKMLGSSTFEERKEASRLLEEIGEPALDHLIPLTNSTDPEIRNRARELVMNIRKKIGTND